MRQQIKEKASRIKLFISDVDGVLTDGKIYIGNKGGEFKSFNSKDGLGIKRAQKAGLRLALITGRCSRVVDIRAGELGIEEVHQGVTDKLKVLNSLLARYSLAVNETAYIGDDLTDLPVMKKTGLSFAVADAVIEVKEEADVVTKIKGGEGAVREAIEIILVSQTETGKRNL